MKRIAASGVGILIVIAGCAGPGPRLFPAEPMQVIHLDNGATQRWYDRNSNGVGDCCEQLDRDGRVTQIGYAQGDGEPDMIELDKVPADQQRHLVLLLDSVPIAIVREMYEAGRLRYCYPPGRTIAPFPVMTDLSFSDFFGNSPSPGIESEYFNGETLTSGFTTYAAGGNVPWEKYVDYRLHPMLHAEAYLDPYPWFSHELRAIGQQYMHCGQEIYVGYCVGTSAVGAKYGREGHVNALCEVDRFCQQLLFDTRGRARITLLSDHGHAFTENSKRIELGKLMKAMGYCSGRRLRDDQDVVVPEFGMVSSAVMHTKSPGQAAQSAIQIEGIEIAAYLDGDDMIVLSKDGRARVSHRDRRWRYVGEQGDPLELKPVLEQMKQKDQVDANGYVSDADLFAASAEAPFPDAVQRLWRSFHGLVEHSPDVVLSLDQQYYVGAESMTKLIKLVGIHGSLRQQSSSGFAISMNGPLPPVERMPDLRASLRKIGVPIGGVEDSNIPRALTP